MLLFLALQIGHEHSHSMNSEMKPSGNINQWHTRPCKPLAEYDAEAARCHVRSAPNFSSHGVLEHLRPACIIAAMYPIAVWQHMSDYKFAYT